MGGGREEESKGKGERRRKRKESEGGREGGEEMRKNRWSKRSISKVGRKKRERGGGWLIVRKRG